jgi:putative transposase
LKALCKVMEVSRSGYYHYLKKEPYETKKVVLLTEVKILAQLSRNSYGSRRMSQHLKAKGYAVGRYQARTLMHQAGVACKQRRRYRITTQSNHHLPIAENKLNRDFNAERMNQKWVTDITFLWTAEGWLYIAAVLDLFSRRVVGWALAEHMREELVGNALHMALGRRQPSKGLLHHSDRGCQYASTAYQKKLEKAGIEVSMSRKGNCWDNSVMERFFGSLKSERTDHTIYPTREAAKADVIDYIEMFYNSQRLHSTLGYLTPLQFEHNFA